MSICSTNHNTPAWLQWRREGKEVLTINIQLEILSFMCKNCVVEISDRIPLQSSLYRRKFTLGCVVENTLVDRR